LTSGKPETRKQAVDKPAKAADYEAFMVAHAEIGGTPQTLKEPPLLPHPKSYRDTSLIRNRIPPRTIIGPQAYAYCWVRRFLMSEVPL